LALRGGFGYERTIAVILITVSPMYGLLSADAIYLVIQLIAQLRAYMVVTELA
jgi:hypothetical protein